ncbi:hypothetical protein Pint_07821 [Pistacia integerrima]|uniref:Uncharacterized protein n=1 Tax=Pistacia integerrima TaxID=434235 RepID=A0ACC0XTC3_9ROSI|nr:hypothetical protein Pint_07821 [Pistacia integerrima]
MEEIGLGGSEMEEMEWRRNYDFGELKERKRIKKEL